LLRSKPAPSREEIIRGMDGNLWRCGANTRIIDATQSAATDVRKRRSTT